MRNKFKLKDNRSFAKKLSDTAQSSLFWRSRKKGMITTRTIDLSDIRSVFAPRNFYERYQYLGSIPWNEDGKIFEAMEPLVIYMDYKAKPAWCPRWVLRFLHLFGNDNSIVRVRNRTLHNLKNKLTKGIMLVDYKTKWEWYDLRISVHGDKQINDLANMIESEFYRKGQRIDLIEELKRRGSNPERPYWTSTSILQEELDSLIDVEEAAHTNTKP